MRADPVRLERDGPLSVMVLEDPPLNLFNDRTFSSLHACIDEIEHSDTRALVFRAEGRVFTGGVDVHLFERAVEGGGGELSGGLIYGALLEPVRRLEALSIPTLALVHELCLTWGLEVALALDMIWAGESARFGLVEARLGLSPGAGGTQRMVERVGAARAKEFVMTGGLYDAATLERWGAVNRVLPDDQLLEQGMRFAHELASGPTKAHEATKNIVRAYFEGGMDGADRFTPDATGPLFATDDLRSAVRSFLSEGPGKATFEGR